ncbi:hypothetical protein BC628DRAFT_943038 [Trametes gibbosa]|nr:hypothetical protein BC628DRAFT_943038 [Trametes gibbosa]
MPQTHLGAGRAYTLPTCPRRLGLKRCVPPPPVCGGGDLVWRVAQAPGIVGWRIGGGRTRPVRSPENIRLVSAANVRIVLNGKDALVRMERAGDGLKPARVLRRAAVRVGRAAEQVRKRTFRAERPRRIRQARKQMSDAAVDFRGATRTEAISALLCDFSGAHRAASWRAVPGRVMDELGLAAIPSHLILSDTHAERGEYTGCWTWEPA